MQLICYLSVLADGSASHASGTIIDKRELNSCGRNSLYLFLKAHNPRQQFKEVAARVAIDESGTSLRELRRVAKELGQPCTVRHCSVAQLANCDLPCIAHMKYSSLERRDGGGHYCLVLSVSATDVVFIDGTLGQILTYQRDRFGRYWTGYVLEQADASPYFWVCSTAIAAVALLLTYGMLRPKRRAVMACRLLILILLVSPSQAPAKVDGGDRPGSSRMWRGAGSDATVCLYLQTRMLNLPVGYDDVDFALRRLNRSPTLSDICAVGRQMGMEADVRMYTPVELKGAPLPLITHLFARNGKGGQFVLVHSISADRIGCIDGATASIIELSSDDFRRRWSGYAVCTSADLAESWILSASTAGGAMLLYCIYRFGRRNIRSHLVRE